MDAALTATSVEIGTSLRSSICAVRSAAVAAHGRARGKGLRDRVSLGEKISLQHRRAVAMRGKLLQDSSC